MENTRESDLDGREMRDMGMCAIIGWTGVLQITRGTKIYLFFSSFSLSLSSILYDMFSL